MRNIVFIIFSTTLFLSCQPKKVDMQEEHTITKVDTIKLRTTEVKGHYRLFTGLDFNQPRQFLLDQKGSHTDSLFLTKDKYAVKDVFIYRYRDYWANDTLELFKDSSVKFNSKKLQFLSSKRINSGDSEFLISKYLYDPQGGDLSVSNLFFNDSLGILYKHTFVHGKFFIQYKMGRDYETLQRKIFSDTTFFEFEVNY